MRCLFGKGSLVLNAPIKIVTMSIFAPSLLRFGGLQDEEKKI